MLRVLLDWHKSGVQNGAGEVTKKETKLLIGIEFKGKNKMWGPIEVPRQKVHIYGGNEEEGSISLFQSIEIGRRAGGSDSLRGADKKGKGSYSIRRK